MESQQDAGVKDHIILSLKAKQDPPQEIWKSIKALKYKNPGATSF